MAGRGSVVLRVVFVTAELSPLAKVGGLADVASSLPRALRRGGHEVFVVTPRYGTAAHEAAAGIRIRPTGTSFDLSMDGAMRRVSVSRARLNGVPTFFLENEDYFAGRSVYGDEGGDYPDNACRFALFARAALSTTRALDLEPAVFHVHDWQSALLPVYQKVERPDRPTPTVLTVHNLAYQGVFPAGWLDRVELPRSLFHIDGLEFYGKLNFLKGGLVTAERLTTVSPTYAREIQSEALGAGLDGVMRTRSDRLTGILNGIEPNDWHPGKDPALVAHYASTRLDGKRANKLALQRELGLRSDPRAPILAAIGRLDPQKGFDILLEAAPALLGSGNAQLVVLGAGDTRLLDAFVRLSARHPGAISANRGFNDELGRRIYAGADLFLMPSRYEPCGLGQMIALRYGTLPVVRATGGLADSIRDLDANPAGGNGFSFVPLSAVALVGAVRRALALYDDEKTWTGWVRRAMREDFSWKRSAEEYVEVYRQAVEG